MPRRFLFLGLFACLLVIHGAPPLRAEGPARAAAPAAGETAGVVEAEVAAVRFRPARTGGAPHPWTEMEVEVQVRGAGGGSDAGSRFVNRLRCEVVLAYELRGVRAQARAREFYRAAATAVALEPGRHSFRFYLPSEVVRRDNLPTEPRFWLVSLATGDRELPLTARGYGSGLASPESAGNFRAVAATEAVANDGVLLPQWDSPWAFEYPRDTPSFVRPPRR